MPDEPALTPVVSVVIVNWNTRADLRVCLTALAREVRLPSEAIVVDNGSNDGSAALVRAEFPAVRLIANPDNRGFAAASNQGLAVARGHCLLLLNPDVVVQPGAIETLVAALEANPRLGAVGPLLLDSGSDTPGLGYYRRFPSFLQVLLFQTGLRRLAERWPALVARLWEPSPGDDDRAVDQVPGACLLMRREALEQIGPLDARTFPLWYEDVDWCWRLAQAGWGRQRVAAARVWHRGGASFALRSLAWRKWRWHRGLLRCLARHRGRPEAELTRWLLWTLEAGRALRARLAGCPEPDAELLRRRLAGREFGPLSAVPSPRGEGESETRQRLDGDAGR